MKLCFGNFDCTEVWDGVFYKKLSAYPNITDWELRTILEFMDYEKRHHRDCPVECGDPGLRELLASALKHRERYQTVPRPRRITECTACPKRRGCETEFVCHTTSVENAVSILRCGSLLSPVRARGLDAHTLSREPRNAAKDPEDYFDYIMFAWGNCQGGDRLVMERKLGRFPDERDLSTGFTPGIRFYFRYETLAEHPNRVFDGVLPMKIKDEVRLADWVYRIVVPEEYRSVIEECLPDALRPKVLYIVNDCQDIWEWAEKVYSLIEIQG